MDNPGPLTTIPLKKRSKNFSSGEKDCLITIIQDFKHILECHITNKKSTKAKNDAWVKISTIFNSQNTNLRPIDTLRSLYDSLKKDVKKALASHKVRH